MQENTKKILSINERIVYILDYYNVSRYKFSQETGISEAVLLNIFKGKNKPSADFIEKLLNKYKAVNANWLIAGVGEPFINNDTDIINDADPPPYKKHCPDCREKERIIDALKESLKSKDITIKSLLEQIELLKSAHCEAHEPCGQKRKAG